MAAKRIDRVGCWAIAGALLLGGPALAQYREYFIRGKVVDAQKQGVADMEIRLRDTTTQLEAIGLASLEVRLAGFLLAALGNRRALVGKRVALELGFSQGELSHLLGASRPKVNEAMGMLEKAGALRRTQDRIFCDPGKLALMAGRRDEA